MEDNDSFSSLMDLVNSHLSKTSLNTSQSGDEASSFPLASVRIQNGMSQTVFTPPNGIMSIPRLVTQDNEINEILAQQVTNMLIAKEKKREEEDEKKKKLEEEILQKKLKKQEEDSYVIDLMSSIINPKRRLPEESPRASTSRGPEYQQTGGKGVSNRKSVRDLMVELDNPRDYLPVNQDMSYMVIQKVKKSRPSAFGKIMSARVRPIATPYFKIEINNPLVKRFDFGTQSPCDINLEKRRHPPFDPYAHLNMVERFMAQTSDVV